VFELGFDETSATVREWCARVRTGSVEHRQGTGHDRSRRTRQKAPRPSIDAIERNDPYRADARAACSALSEFDRRSRSAAKRCSQCLTRDQRKIRRSDLFDRGGAPVPHAPNPSHSALPLPWEMMLAAAC
jgi:hypothetical protein